MKNLFPVISSLALIGLLFWIAIFAFVHLDLPKESIPTTESKNEVLTENASQINPLIKTGKRLFKTNCASCHHNNMRTKLTGPALGNTESKWKDYPRIDLHSWIRNSTKLIESEHPRALEIFKEYRSPMPSFPNLTDEEIESILSYINAVVKKEV